MSCPGVLANIYRYDLNTYSLAPGSDDPGGTISGFFVLDYGLAVSDPNFSRTENGASIQMPNWIQSASLTFTASPDSGLTSFTRTTSSAIDPLQRLAWTISPSAASNGGFNTDNDLTSELITLGFDNFNEFSGADTGPTATPLSQQFGGDEFILGNPVNSTPVPGPLPLLGLVPLAWYFRQFKKKSIKS